MERYLDAKYLLPWSSQIDAPSPFLVVLGACSFLNSRKVKMKDKSEKGNHFNLVSKVF